MGKKAENKDVKKRACMICKKMIPEDEGIVTLRGMAFTCKDCYKKQKKNNKSSESCEFC